MTRALLDLNLLLALLDSDHIDHRAAHEWLATDAQDGWASCPITENGFVRIISQPRYPSPISPARAIDLLDRARRGNAHEFWPCTPSLLDDSRFERTMLHGPRRVTDAHLLAVAVEHGARFVTFDRSVPVSAVRGASERNLTVL